MKILQKTLFVLLIAFLFGCGTKNKEIVINLDEIKDVTSEKFINLNIVDNKGDAVYFNKIRDIIFSADSHIIVICDSIVQLDKDGNFKKYIERPDTGPRVFNNTRETGIYYNGNHYITDNSRQNLLQKYDKDMNYLTSYKIKIPYTMAFINENEILSINEKSDKHIFCILDTLGNVIKSFGDIEGNEEGVIEEVLKPGDIEKKKEKIDMQFVYDTLYKHIFLFSNYEPIIRRFDLNGKLLQRINLEAAFFDKKRSETEETKQMFANTPGVMVFTHYIMKPSIVEGKKLLINIPDFGSLVLKYDDKNITDKSVIKYETVTVDSVENKQVIPNLSLKDFNSIKLLYDYKNIFVNIKK